MREGGEWLSEKRVFQAEVTASAKALRQNYAWCV